MSIEPIEPGHDVTPRPEAAPEEYDTSFEVALDDDPGTATPILVDAVAKVRHDRRPVIPDHLRTVQGVRRATARSAKLTGYRLSYHTVRSPLYVLLAAWWAVIGLLRLAGRQLAWYWVMESHSLRQNAATKNDAETWVKLHTEARKARGARAVWLVLELLAVAAVVTWLMLAAPGWVKWVVLAILVPILAHLGRPADRPIVSAAVVTNRHRVLNADIVLRAYYSAGLGHPDKPGQQVKFGSKMSRDRLDAGSQVVVDLPYGVTFSDAMAKREKLASGLDVSQSQVYLTRDKTSNRRHLLWVADVDPLSIPAGRTPLLDCKPRDIWRAAPLGVDERGRRVMLPLMFSSMLVGAQPRKGKTFTARALALYAALDPYVRLSVFDGKGSPDWRKFALVAYTFGFGLLPDRIQGDPIENLRATLRAAKRDVLARNARLSELPTDVCPEGKLTRDIARNPRFRMPVWVIILDEFQEYLNTGDEDTDREIAELLVFLVKVGPSVGVILLSSTQRPSGIGSTGKVAKLFTDFRDNHLTRFALKTGSWQVSDLVLGPGAYSEGYDSSALPSGDDYRGVGILHDAPVPSATVRTYLADGQDAEKILHAARRTRERVGLLDGMAGGETVGAQARDPLADALDAFLPGETALGWQQLAERMADQLPERYADATPDAISNTLRSLNLGIESKNVRVDGRVLKGVHLAALRRALESRSGEEGR
jgi:DNA segregation ATPase FtsK/SpoIIIE, S-DNA-T family